jgi:hypothetical protein
MHTLNTNALRLHAPSIFATSPWDTMSNRYRFVPTIDVLNTLADHGFYPVKAAQSRTRIPGKGNFTRHMVRLRHENYLTPTAVGDEVPEVVLVNSHDGTSAYKFLSGIFCLVCSNGMIVCAEDMGSVSVRHQGGQDAEDFSTRVIDATFQVVDGASKAMERIGEWKQIELSDPQRTAFATAALELRGEAAVQNFRPTDLLRPRRYEDNGKSLWTTVNVVQEHLTKGGDTGLTPKGRRTRTRPVKSVTEDVRLNKAIWTLAEQLAKAVA